GAILRRAKLTASRRTAATPTTRKGRTSLHTNGAAAAPAAATGHGLPVRRARTPVEYAADPDLLRKRRSFHRGDTVNYLPNRADYFSSTFLEDYILKGWIPAQPILNRSTRITAFGSCFAANITKHLTSIGFNLSSKRDPGIYISRIGDGLVNT